MKDFVFLMVGNMIILPYLTMAAIRIKAAVRSRRARAGREVMIWGRAVGPGLPKVHLGVLIVRPGVVEMAETRSSLDIRRPLPTPLRPESVVIVERPPPRLKDWFTAWDSRPLIRYESARGEVDVYCRYFDIDVLVTALAAMASEAESDGTEAAD